MYSNISKAACSRPSKVLAWTHSDLMTPIRDSVTALSHGDDMAPMEGLMPFSLIRRATRLRDVDTPLALSLMKTLGAP